jgi:hypothetical protein
MAQKSDEEVYEYVLNYQNDLIKDLNNESNRLFDKANEFDSKTGSDIIVLSSAGLALLGALAVSQPLQDDILAKVCISISGAGLVGSIIFGIIYYHVSGDFWRLLGTRKHEQAGMIYKSPAKTAEELEKLLEKLAKEQAEDPLKNNTRAKTIQIWLFCISVIIALTAMISLLF